MEWIFDATYEDRFWRATWRRVSPGGQAFDDDRYWLNVCERLGLLSFKSTMYTQYQEGTAAESEIKKEAAIKRGLKHVATTLRNPQFSSFVPRRKHSIDPVPHGVELKIVRPNYFHQTKNIHLIEESREGRLAWVMIFSVWPGTSYEEAKKRDEAPASAVIVWIDAITGEYLGGDLMPY